MADIYHLKFLNIYAVICWVKEPKVDKFTKFILVDFLRVSEDCVPYIVSGNTFPINNYGGRFFELDPVLKTKKQLWLIYHGFCYFEQYHGVI